MKDYLIFLLTVFLISFILIGLFSTYIGPNPLESNYTSKYQLTKILPEGWGFFTRDPREPIFRLFKYNEDSLTEIKMNNSSLKSIAGVSRSKRRFNLEFHRLKSIIPDSIYVEVENPLKISSYKELFHLEDTRGMDYHYVKDGGTYAISEEQVKPWLYKNKNINYDNKFKIAKFKFTNKKDK